jgi:hypothetical protein
MRIWEVCFFLQQSSGKLATQMTLGKLATHDVLKTTHLMKKGLVVSLLPVGVGVVLVAPHQFDGDGA